MSLLAVIGAGIQLAFLLLSNWFKYADEKKAERKTLYESGKKALADRDASALTAVFDGLR